MGAVAWNLHPIKLQFLHLHKVLFEAHDLPESLAAAGVTKAPRAAWTVNVRGNVEVPRARVIASVAFCAEEAEGGVSEAASGEPDAKRPVGPYTLEVEVIAGFVFDPKEISPAEVDEWCKKGSFFVLCPYLRHVIAEITRDSGFPEIYLPLLEVPTFRPPPAHSPKGRPRPAARPPTKADCDPRS